MPNRTFAEIFSQALNAHDQSLGKVSARLHALGFPVNKSTLTRWKNGTTHPSFEHLETLRHLPRALYLTPAETTRFQDEVSQALGFNVTGDAGAAQPAPFPQRIHLGSSSLPAFAGRSRELAALQDRITRRKPVAITGLGGVGKTRLAQELLAVTVKEFAHGCEYLQVVPGQSRLEVLRSIGRLLGVRLNEDALVRQDLVQLARQISLHTYGIDLLFLVDNVESAVQVRDLVDRLPGITWVFTARRLSLKNAGVYTLALQPPPKSEALQVMRANMQNMLSYSPDQAVELEGVVERLGCLPQALRLAASLLDNSILASPAELNAWLAQKGLVSSQAFGSNLRLLFAGMLENTPAMARRVFELCGLFSSPRLQLATLQAVARRLDIQLSPADWNALGDLSLLTSVDDRLVELHPLLHEYARLRLKNSSHYNLSRQEFIAYYLELAEKVALPPSEAERDYWQLTPEEANMMRVAEDLQESSSWDGLRRMQPAFSGYLWSSGSFADYASFQQKCLRAAAALEDRPWEAKVRSELGFMKMEQRQPEEADSLFRQAQAYYDEDPSQLLAQARLRRYRAILECDQDHLETAAALLQEAEDRLSCLTNPPETQLDIAWLLLHSAKMRVYLRQGKLAEAEAEGWAADHIRSTINTRGGFRSAGYKIILGNVLLAQERYDEAISLWEGMLDEQQGQALAADHADAQTRLAWLYAQRDKLERASELLSSARQVYLKTGDLHSLEVVEDFHQRLVGNKRLPEYKEITTR